jgi:molybdopterin-guanine dinucleotide biosynthesis protein A
MADDVPQSPRWSALLMAGGQSRRMGRDKATLIVGGEELWRRQVRTLREAGASEIMVARAGRELFDQPGLVAVRDAAPGCGPLGGLVAGLRQANWRWLLALAVDLPFMPAPFLREMVTGAAREGCGVVPVSHGRFEPLAAVYASASLALAEECLAHQRWSLQGMVERCMSAGLMRSLEVCEDERGYFRNVNTPEELAEAERILGGQA